ncbi:MAG: hypothetical protein GEV04_21035 [Actinophytocola sp.]|nr:hypothetical protein [Actinophytocola sp.]
MARRRRRQSEGLSAREQARVQAAVTTALAALDKLPRTPGTQLESAPNRQPEPPTHEAETTAESHRDRHGRVRHSGWRSLVHRNRRQLLPWKVTLAVALSGYLAAFVGWAIGESVLVGQITTATCATAVVALLIGLRRKHTHPYWSGWLLTCTINGGAWITTTAFCGASYPLLVWLCASPCLLGLRWWRHVRHPAAATDTDSGTGHRGAQLLHDWVTNAGCSGGPAPGTRLTNLTPYRYGYTGELRLVRGKQSLADIQAALPRLSTALDVAREHLVVEEHPDGPPSRLRIQIVTKSPVTTAAYFDQPVYRDGRILLGPYADGLGDASFVLHSDDSMESGYVLGSKGSGKSRVLETIALTAIATTPTVVFYLDGQNGASSPLLWEHALWHAGPGDAPEMLRSLLAIKDYRQLYNRKHRLTGFTLSAELPGILVIVDECHKIFTDQTAPRWADVAREGRKLGIGILAASQVTTLDAFGGGQQADALRSSLVSSNGIALRTASKVQSTVFPGLSVDLMSLPKLPGYGYTVDDGDDQHRTAPFRARWLIDAKQAAGRDEPLPDGIHTAEDWFAAVAPTQQLDERSADAAGAAFASRHEKAAREQAELDALFATAPGASASSAATGRVDDSTGVIVPFPDLPNLPPFDPENTGSDREAEEPATPPPAPADLSDAQYRVWDAIACGVVRSGDIADALGISGTRVRVLLGELVNAGHIEKVGHGRYAITSTHRQSEGSRV